MSNIDHDLNGPFVRAHCATPEPQTETVYGLEATYSDGVVEVWNTRTHPHTLDEQRGLAESARWSARHDGHGSVVSIKRVSREVTIVATEWSEGL